MQDEEFGRIWFGSEIIWLKQLEVVIKSVFVPSVDALFFLHHFTALAFKSPVMTTYHGFIALISLELFQS